MTLCESKHRSISNDITKKDTEMAYMKKTLSKIGTDSDKCPVCLKNISDHDRSHISTEKEKITQSIDDIQKNINELTAKCDTVLKLKDKIKAQDKKLRTDKHQLQEDINSNNNIEQKVKQLQAWNDQITEDIQGTKNEKNKFIDLISESSIRLESIQSCIDDHKKDLHVLDIVKFIVSEEGVKSYIVKKILQLLNSKLAYYLKRMDANCICYFNEYFEEQIIDEKGTLCSYFNFSGAERKSIDLACLFAFMDIRRLQGDVSFNFSIYDELFDSSFDEKGVELVLGILKERIEKHNECVFVISHRKESVKMATGDIIQLEKKNGITTRIENMNLQQ